MGFPIFGIFGFLDDQKQGSVSEPVIHRRYLVFLWQFHDPRLTRLTAASNSFGTLSLRLSLAGLSRTGDVEFAAVGVKPLEPIEEDVALAMRPAGAPIRNDVETRRSSWP
jgi:hypothetical protein